MKNDSNSRSSKLIRANDQAVNDGESSKTKNSLAGESSTTANSDNFALLLPLHQLLPPLEIHLKTEQPPRPVSMLSIAGIDNKLTKTSSIKTESNSQQETEFCISAAPSLPKDNIILKPNLEPDNIEACPEQSLNHDIREEVPDLPNLNTIVVDKQPRPLKIHTTKSKYLFKRKITFGNNPWMFVATNILVLAPSILFLVFVCPYLWINFTPASPVIFFALICTTVFLMYYTSFSDPGIIPRKFRNFIDKEESAWVTDVISQELSEDYYIARFCNVNGVEYPLKFCTTCGIHRPLRASHCRQCDHCIEKHDHHCIWLNNCIGKHNYKSFFFFILFAFISCCYMLAFSILHLVCVSLELQTSGAYVSFIDVLQRIPMSLVLAIYTFIFMFSVGSLLNFHFYLVSNNMTTHEKLFPGNRYNGENPFNTGSIIKNWKEVIFQASYPSSESGPEMI